MAKTCTHSNNNLNERAWALCASLLFHALLVLVLSTTSSFDPTLGRSTRFDIFWVSPSVAAPISPTSLDQPVQEIPHPRSADVAELRTEAAADLPAAAPASHADPDQVRADATPRVTAEEPQKLAAKGSHAEMAMAIAIPAPITLPAVRPAAVPAAKNPPVVGAVMVPAAKMRTATFAVAKPAATPAVAKPQGDRHLRSQSPLATSAVAQPAAESHPAEQQQLTPITEAVFLSVASVITAAATAGKEIPRTEKVLDAGIDLLQTQVHQTALKAEKIDQVHEQMQTSQPEPLITAQKPQVTVTAQLSPGRKKAQQQLRTSAKPVQLGKSASIATNQSRKPASGTTIAAAASSTMSPTLNPNAGLAPAAKVNHQATSSEKPPGTRGIVIASLRGDLKMVIAGDSSIKLLVTFREFPKARRNRVQTRAEAKREQRIVPVFVRTQHETREAVIETAREGIYLFSAESGQGEPAQATFTLKLFETGSREKVTQIGTRNISGKVVLAKILMPEGILWDDEAAFTGSLEDSNSTTKFNAQTGLYWREYND